MTSSIGSTSTATTTTTASSNTAQIAALERQLAQFEKQLQADQAAGGSISSAAATQLVV